MLLESRQKRIHGNDILLRPLAEEDAEIVLHTYIQILGESPFLNKYADEAEGEISLEDEKEFIAKYNNSQQKAILGAFVNGEYAGNASFSVCGESRREKHRCSIGIALKDKFTSIGIGRFLLETILEECKNAGFAQVELNVCAGNTRAKSLYCKLGFRQCGRIPNAIIYDDGRTDDTIKMVKTN